MTSDPASPRFRDETDPSVIRDPLLRDLKALWQKKRGVRAAPARADFEKSDLRPFLSSLFLFDALKGGEDFRFRLIGSTLTEPFGRDSRGGSSPKSTRSAIRRKPTGRTASTAASSSGRYQSGAARP